MKKQILFMIALCMHGIIIQASTIARNDLLSEEEYTRYMKIIQEIDAELAEQLQEYTRTTQQPALLKATEIDLTTRWVFPDESHAAPRLYLHPTFLEFPPEQQKRMFYKLTERYHSQLKEHTAKEITRKEMLALRETQQRVLAIIESLAPELYAKLIKIDPSDLHTYITKSPNHDYSKITYLPYDGLPRILVGKTFMDDSYEEQRHDLAHELGHYALGHFELPVVSHKALSKERDLYKKEFSPGKKVMLQNPSFVEFFEKAARRVNEFEADRFAILSLQTDIQAALAWMKRQLQREILADEKFKREMPACFIKAGYLPTTLNDTHPSAKSRIAQFEDLQRELELQKVHNTPRTVIDWDALASHYKGSMPKQPE